MKNPQLFLFLAILIGSISTNQAYSQIEAPFIELKSSGFSGTDSTKNYIVIEVPNYSKDQLFKLTHAYLNSIYQNPAEVISVVEGESIVVNGFTNSIKGDLEWYEYPMHYQIIYQFKDEKIRFEPSITDLKEIWSTSESARKIYIKNTDSPKDVEINAIYMKNKDNSSYFLFKEDLKSGIDRWIKFHVNGLTEAIKADDW